MMICCPLCGATLGGPDSACRDCGMAVGNPAAWTLPEGNDDDEVVFEMTDWLPAERMRVTSALGDEAVPWRWEPGLDLVVRMVDEERTEDLLDRLAVGWEEDDGPLADGDGLAHWGGADGVEGEDGDEDEADDEGDEDDADDADARDAAAQAAMADLFVAADRLMHEPNDGDLAADLAEAAEIVDSVPAPFGIEDRVWSKVRDLAATVLADLAGDADDETVASDAQILRETLRSYV